MTIQTGTATTPDGLTLHTFEALPDGQPKAVVYLVHGIGEHTGRYLHVIAHLKAHGYAVYGHDHRHHGRSTGEPRVGFRTFDGTVEDLKRRIDNVRALHPSLKLFVYGHSMGSLISTLTLIKYPSAADGFVSSGSPLRVDSALPAAVRPLVLALANVLPNLPLGPIDLSTLSRDPQVIEAYRSDPLNVLKPTTLATAALFGRALPPARANLGRITMPVLVLHGDKDTLTPPAGSQTLYDGVGATDKTLKFYPGLLHEIHNEPEQAEVLADITTWLDAHL
jgi:alpha-beta hydrolase superfamily lysophospholipase